MLAFNPSTCSWLVDLKLYTIVKCVFQCIQVRQKRKSKFRSGVNRNCPATGSQVSGSITMVIHSPPSSNTAEGNHSPIFIFNASFDIRGFYLFPGASAPDLLL